MSRGQVTLRALRSAFQGVTSRLLQTEGIAYVEDETVGSAVTARGQRRRHIHEPHPEIIDERRDAQPSRIGQHPAQRLVHRTVPRSHKVYQIHVEAEVPEGRVRLRGRRDELADLQRVARQAVLPLELHTVVHGALYVSRARLVHGIETRA